MTYNEFVEKLEKDIQKYGLVPRKPDTKNVPTYDFNDFSSLGNMYSGMIFDFDSRNIWIRIPCTKKGFEKFAFEINIRVYDQIDLRGSELKLNVRGVEMRQILNCNWQTISYNEFEDSYKLLKMSPDFENLKRYISPSMFRNRTKKYYEYDENFFENIILPCIHNCNMFFETCTDKLNNIKVLFDEKTFPSYRSVRKLFCQDLKNDYKTIFGEYFRI